MVVVTPPLRVGAVLHGFCHGAFGRDSYGDKRVEAIGADWIVVRNQNGLPIMAQGSGIVETLEEFQNAN
jgi:hypothetical protein